MLARSCMPHGAAICRNGAVGWRENSPVWEKDTPDMCQTRTGLRLFPIPITEQIGDIVMNIRIWGTRGSYPVARAEMMRYGGNTTCIEVRVGPTCILLDAGSGLRLLGEELMQAADAPAQLHLLISHTHWDHILGFPFFAPIYAPHVQLSIYGLQRTQSKLRTTIDQALSDPLLPIGLDRLSATLNFFEINHDVSFELGQDVYVTSARANHPYRALGYRIESATGTVVFVPDTGPFHTILFGDEFIVWKGTPPQLNSCALRTLERMRQTMIDLARGADWLIYDTQFTEAQYAQFPHWGHGTPAQAMEIAHAAGVRELLLFHHDPHRTDTELDAILAAQQALAPAGLRVRVAYEGMVLSREQQR